MGVGVWVDKWVSMCVGGWVGGEWGGCVLGEYICV